MFKNRRVIKFVLFADKHTKSLVSARYTASVVHVLLTESDFPLRDNVGARPKTVYWAYKYYYFFLMVTQCFIWFIKTWINEYVGQNLENVLETDYTLIASPVLVKTCSREGVISSVFLFFLFQSFFVITRFRTMFFNLPVVNGFS